MPLKEMCGLNPKRSWASRRATLMHNILLIVETAIVSGMITVLWMVCHKTKWPFHVHKDVELIMFSTGILFCAAEFGFVAATLFAQVRQRNVLLSRAALLGQELEFMLNRDEKYRS